ncbi:alpha/beta fold hydrolase [Paraconexibacter algicola]|uniref:Alpha/beta hydrolase n=1 Tax=Paraconexibacter algicola TaxID=2133960 RepID=A0A2T4UDN5_9ACTN|nr:alpha/beta hydrolase [Paraconexibacter algicola]PTL55542.1 alpha/beta hydrolase [Paraconexibacter algicola]
MSVPVLLLHSGGMSSRQFGRLAAALQQDGRVVHAPDLLGHGDAPDLLGDGPFDLEVELRRLEDLVDGLRAEAGVPAVDLVGHSYGGLVALHLVRRRPDTVRRLALFEPVAFGVLRDPPDEEGLASLAVVAEDSIFRDPDPDDLEPWLRVFVDFWSGPGAWDALGDAGRASFLHAGRTLVGGIAAVVDDRTTVAALEAVGQPTLLLSGGRSPLAARRVAAVLAAGLADARLHTIDDAGHMGPLTHGGEVNDRVVAHLAA